MKSQIAAALLVASMALGGASIASAASTPADTIDVLQTTVNPAGNHTSVYDGWLPSGPNNVQIKFVNRGDQAATAITFQVDSLGTPVAAIEDVGTFSKDAVVTHSFTIAGDPNATVSVVGVKYADGSAWSANGQQPFVSRRQAASVAP